MNHYKFKLEPYNGINTRFICPECNDKNKTFTRYIDTETGKYLDSTVGRCNREDSCGYHYSPKQYFEDNNISFDKSTFTSNQQIINIQQVKPITYISIELFKASLTEYKSNNLITYLINLFGIEITNELINKYSIGTSKHWDGSTVFWQIDMNDKVRTGKIMLYDPTTGKRKKEPYNHINWVHTVMNVPDFNLKQCLFGEHLLKDKKPVAIVESEKTAIIASVYLPQFNWLATGGSNNLNRENCSVLKDFRVILYPDVNCYDNWEMKVQSLSSITNFAVSNLLEINSTEKEKQQGWDIADYLINCDDKKFKTAYGTDDNRQNSQINDSFELIRLNELDDEVGIYFRFNGMTLKYYKEEKTVELALTVDDAINDDNSRIFEENYEILKQQIESYIIF